MSKQKIAFQGEMGAYSHIACEKIFPGSSIKACPTFEETFKDDATQHVRQNKHKLYMDTQKHILSIAKNIGFILQGKIDMVTAQYQYQYMYLLYKPE